jgi:hypothetical protein
LREIVARGGGFSISKNSRGIPVNLSPGCGVKACRTATNHDPTRANDRGQRTDDVLSITLPFRCERGAAVALVTIGRTEWESTEARRRKSPGFSLGATRPDEEPVLKTGGGDSRL